EVEVPVHRLRVGADDLSPEPLRQLDGQVGLPRSGRSGEDDQRWAGLHRVEYDALTMAEPYVQEYRARWADMDFNQHMRNAAYLGVAEETRMRFMEANGWPMPEFARRKLGPVVVEDRIIYRKELGLLEAFRVDLMLAATSDDGRKFRVRNRFFR